MLGIVSGEHRWALAWLYTMLLPLSSAQPYGVCCYCIKMVLSEFWALVMQVVRLHLGKVQDKVKAVFKLGGGAGLMLWVQMH